ncbi:hypothetical protein Tco_0549297 [Tanacetum coccineum]
MENSIRGTIPMQENMKFSKSQGASTPVEIQRMQNIPYASAVGSTMYVVRCTRRDVAFTQNITSRFQQNPGEVYWTAVKNILKYLGNTKDMFLVYGGDMKRELRVSCYTDAGYLTDANDMKSQTGYVFILNGETVWIGKFISGLGVVPTIEEPINMYCDNTRAIAVVKDHGVTKGNGNPTINSPGDRCAAPENPNAKEVRQVEAIAFYGLHMIPPVLAAMSLLKFFKSPKER